MAFARAQTLRSLQKSFTSASRPVARSALPRRTQQLVSKRWSSGGGGHGEPSSDLPWAIGAVVVTVPSAYFLWPSASSHDSHGHDEEHGEEEEHEEGGEEAEGASSSDSSSDSTPDDSADSNPSDGVNDEAKTDPSAPSKDTTDTEEAAKETPETAKASGSQGEGQAQNPDANKESYKGEGSEAKGPAAGANKSNVGKGPMNENAPEDTRKREPDAKGGYKKRVDSGYGKNLGEGPEFADDGEDGPKRESAASAKPAQRGSQGEITGKQYGLSNTPTRHSTQIDQDPEKSKKGEGAPETAKSMGTIDPSRPMAESDQRGKK